MMALPLLVLVGLALLGALLWRRLAPGLRALPEGATAGEGVVYALVGVLAVDLLTSLLVRVLALPDPPPLTWLVGLRAGAALVVCGLVAARAARTGGIARLGLRRTGGPPAPLVALAAWLACLPVVIGLSLINSRILSALDHPQQPQHWLAEFLSSGDARTSPLAWVAMAVVLPAAEELFFRGGLYGGLRRVIATPLAVLASALIFGLVHDPDYLLPAAALGAILALLYEVTGSLATPICFHVLHNAFTLAMVSAYPELT